MASDLYSFALLCPIDVFQITNLMHNAGILYGRLQRGTIPDAAVIQFVLLKISIVLLETC